MTESGSGVRLRLTKFDEITTARGWTTDDERCRQIGISPPQMSKIRNGLSRPGGKFIAHTLAALNVAFDELFEHDVQGGAA